jgi:uncharacterized protein
MSLFLLTFFLLYGGLHAYIFSKVRAAFPLGTLSSLGAALWMLAMVGAPLIVYSAEKHGYEASARLTAFVGFSWMGIAFLFFASSILLDLCRFALFAARWLLHGGIAGPGPLWQFLLPCFFSLAAGAFGFFDALHIRTERVVLASSKIPKEVGRIKIAQISDVHLGMIVRGDRLSRIMAEVKKADPDLLISTGDLVDGQVSRLNGLRELLEEVKPRFGKFAVTGNHEYFAGLQQALDFTRRGGFTVLRGSGLTLAGAINLAGVDDTTGRYYGGLAGAPERELLAGLPRDKFTILLKHRPVVDATSLGLFDLQISGHTHQGQIFPFRIFTRFVFSYVSGLCKLPNGADLYVSRGSGTWGPPIRFLSPPEVTVYELVPG